MSDTDQRVTKLEKQVAVLENESGHVSEDLKTLADRITGMADKKLTPMQKQIKEIHASLHGAKGFVAGIVITISVVWAVIATFGIIVWNWLQGTGN